MHWFNALRPIDLPQNVGLLEREVSAPEGGHNPLVGVF